MIRVDYAGPGGACEGIRSLGLDSYGIEWDAAACATRAAAGHLTIRADLSTYRPGGRPWGYWSSPPCQTFSTAGKGDGRDQLDDLTAVIHAERWADADRFDSRTRHVVDAARVAVTCGAEWVAMEQVPAVLPLWRALAHVLERHGYSTWAGVLCAADYGVPQTRRRAILMASRVRCAIPPAPTHAETPGMFGELGWVSMAEALGWSHEWREGVWVLRHSFGESSPNSWTDHRVDIARPAPTVETKARGWRWERPRSWVVDRMQNSRGPQGMSVPVALVPVDRPSPTLDGQVGGKWVIRDPDWPYERPATTVVSSFRPDVIAAPGWRGPGDGPRQDAEGSVRITVRDALILQGFPPDYPVQGSRTKQFEQVGNAVPPPLAAAVVGALTGRGRR